MMIAPVIFCTIVLGIGSLRSAAQVGKVGSLALVYFRTMSAFALAIGLVVGNIIHPGEGLQLTDELAKKGTAQAGGGGATTTEFLLKIIPTTLVSSLTAGEVLQTLLVALLVGFALQASSRRTGTGTSGCGSSTTSCRTWSAASPVPWSRTTRRSRRTRSRGARSCCATGGHRRAPPRCSAARCARRCTACPPRPGCWRRAGSPRTARARGPRPRR